MTLIHSWVRVRVLALELGLYCGDLVKELERQEGAFGVAEAIVGDIVRGDVHFIYGNTP